MNEITQALLVFASTPPFAVGYCAGLVVRTAHRFFTWLRIAVGAGYKRGRYGKLD